ncbi:hypothetical protein [Nocardia carnea]|uniref:hypothetical protein n=1 Tax=Nocardia carnea TaxID=37328 RepID=UPI0024558A4F|nr:hypothetical protein [Nocardia carnea]
MNENPPSFPRGGTSDYQVGAPCGRDAFPALSTAQVSGGSVGGKDVIDSNASVARDRGMPRSKPRRVSSSGRYSAWLDLPNPGADGSTAGGINPGLPVNVSTLKAALDDARSAAVAPHRYATLLHQYWLAVSARNAQVDLMRWDPNLGARVNEITFRKVYVNYLRLVRENPNFWWIGMAGLAGAPFAGGFSDLSGLRGVIGKPLVRRALDAVGVFSRFIGVPGLQDLPEDIRFTAREGARLTSQDISWYQIRILIMQKHIFTDVVSQHEAFISDGMAGIEEMYRAGLIDDNARTAWLGIASGRRWGLEDALVRIADREQNQIVADQWDVTAAGRGGLGRVMTYASTVLAQPIIPGVRVPGAFAPTTVTGTLAGRRVSLRMPFPNWNWADREGRWAYILHDLIPRHREMVLRPRDAAAVLGTPFSEIFARGQLVNRLPTLASNLSAQWQVSWT